MRICSRQDCKVRNPKSIFRGGKSQYARVTCATNPLISFANPWSHCDDCRALEKERSNRFVSGDWAGWVSSFMSQFPADAAKRNAGSFCLMCDNALSCWMVTSRLQSGHLDLIAGKTFSIRYSQYLSAVTLTGFFSRCQLDDWWSLSGPLPFLRKAKYRFFRQRYIRLPHCSTGVWLLRQGTSPAGCVTCVVLICKAWLCPALNIDAIASPSGKNIFRLCAPNQNRHCSGANPLNLDYLQHTVLVQADDSRIDVVWWHWNAG